MCIICAANIHDTQLFIERDLVPCPRLLNLSHTLELADDSRHSPGWGYVLHGKIDAQEHLHGMPGGGAAGLLTKSPVLIGQSCLIGRQWCSNHVMIGPLR